VKQFDILLNQNEIVIDASTTDEGTLNGSDQIIEKRSQMISHYLSDQLSEAMNFFSIKGLPRFIIIKLTSL
jgi:hypothetical protein